MEMESTAIHTLEQPLYNVIRPVNDLWLWWALADMIGYLLSEIPSKLLGTSFIGTITSLITFVVSTVLVIWVLNRYLGNFDWKRWVVVTVVGILLAIVIVVMLSIPMFIIIKLFSFDTFFKNLVTIVPGATIVGVVISLAQWRVLKHYARGQGRGLWIVASIISTAIFALSDVIVKQFTNNIYLIIPVEAITSALTALIVGYTLMQILRPYAPTSA